MRFTEPVPIAELRLNAEFSKHKSVLRVHDNASGLHGFISIHNDSLGSAVGGTRMFPYTSEKEALADALRLSRAMTYKCALVGVQHGGGKGVIIGDPEINKTESLLRAYAKAVAELRGNFHTGEDVGLTEPDVRFMLSVSPYFIGKPGKAGDPSPFAALSTFYAMQTIADLVIKNGGLPQCTVAIKGVGKVGCELARLLGNVGARLYIADINPAAIDRVKRIVPDAKVITPTQIHKQKVDIYSPCAMSVEFTPKTMTEVKAKIICGAANSQLADNAVGDWFFLNNIFYVPDYIANAGGLIDVVDELESGGFNSDRVLQRIERIKDTVHTVFEFSQDANKPPSRVADFLAEDFFKNS